MLRWLLLGAALCGLPLTQAGCGLTATVVGIVVGTQDSDDDDPIDNPPTGTVETPSGQVNDVIPIAFTLIDIESSLCSVDVHWSTDGGATYAAASATGASGIDGHSGTTGLASSPAGTRHTFYWNSFLDLGTLGLASNYTNVRVRLVVRQADGTGATLETGTIEVVNRYTATVAGGQSAGDLTGIVTPCGLVRRPNGNLLVADLFGQKVVEIDGITGVQTVVAGTGSQGYNGDNQLATQAELSYPSDVAIDAAGNVYIADTGNAAIRRVDAATNYITTVVGGVGWGFNGDNQLATQATLAGPEGISVDASGNLWIADTQNHRVRFVNRGTSSITFTYWNQVLASSYTITCGAGHIVTLAGGGNSATGEDVMPAHPSLAIGVAHLNTPRDVVPIEFAFISPPILLGFTIAESGRDRIRTVSLATGGGDPVNGTAGKQFYGTQVRNGSIRTTVGGGIPLGGGVGDGGQPTQAILRTPYKIHTYYNVLLWIADSGNNRVRLALGGAAGAGAITTLAGTGAFGYSGDGRFAYLATLSSPLGVIADPSFNTIIADTLANRVRMINPQSWSDVFAIGTNNVIGVGGTGTAIRYNGTNFSYPSVGDPQILTGVGASGPSDVVVVGDGGLIRRWSGTAWNAESSGTTVPLLGVWARSATDQMAVGTNGTILRYASGTWSPMTSGTTAQLNDVVQFSGTDARACGSGGLVLRMTGTTWASETTGVTADLDGLAGSATDCWAVGDAGTMIHFKGGSWQDLTGALATAASAATVTVQDLNGVFATGANTCVAVGNNGFIVICDHSGAVPSFTFPKNVTTDDLHGVHGTSSSDVYVVGANDLVLHFNGTGWSQFVLNSSVAYAGATVPAQMIDSLTQPPATPATFISEPTDVELDAAGDLFFSNANTHQIYQLDHVTRDLTVVAGTGAAGYAGDGGPAGPNGALVSVDLNGVWGATASDVWAVGEGGVLLRYNGTSWSVYRAPVEGAAALNDIHGVSGTDAWAVGDGGTLLHWNGTSWTSFTAPSGQDLRGVFAVSSTDVFAVGTKGTIHHWNGTTWTQQAGGATSSNGGPIRDFWDVWGASSTDVWAVGDGSVAATQGPIWNYNGSTWSRVAPPTSPGASVGLRSVFGFGASDVYAVGEGGAIYHWAGSAWAAESGLGSVPNLNAVFGRSGSDLFTGGEFGMFGAGSGGDNWSSGTAANDTIASSITHRAGVAFAGGAAFLVGSAGTVYQQSAAAGAWTLQLGQGQMEAPAGLALYEPNGAGMNPKILFVADSGNDVVRAVNLGTTAYTLFASAAPANRITIQPGAIATVAGGGAALGDNGIATAAQLVFPQDVSVDPQTGDLYVADSGQDRVRLVNAGTGVITTYAGNGSYGFGGDGSAATAAQVAFPVGVTLHRINSTTIELFIADRDNHVIRRVDNGGTITTVAGSGGNGGFNTDGLAATSTLLNEPSKLIVVGTDWYIADTENARVRKVDTTSGNVVSTVLGTGQFGYEGDPKPGVNATVNGPRGMVYDAASDTLYVADAFNDRVRRFRP
ncbi:MAG: hypothetical protein ACYTGX_02535 [Planctomycetota bacterium]